MKQEQIRVTIKQLVSGNLRWCDPNDEVNDSPSPTKPEGFTHQSAEEVLDDILFDLKSLKDELEQFDKSFAPLKERVMKKSAVLKSNKKIV
jgi:hypothetical protein|tara:strand:- start:590 stop:862 length:273 start_codon:yes stop_codon:yes gene_type:complete